MVNRKIMHELRKLKPQRTIYNLISKIRKESGYKLTKEDAANLLAGKLGIDIAKYLEREELERVRHTPTEVKIIETKSKPSSKTIDLKIKDIPVDIPFLQEKIIQDCKKMSETYQLFYLLENSIRFFILSTLQSEHQAEDWWDEDDVVPADIKREVKKRVKREDENRWHAKRGDHPLHYTNFGDLKGIIRQNWGVFRKFFPDQHWIMSRLQDLEFSRNIIAHNNPLLQDEVKMIKLYFTHWTKQMKKESR